MPFSRFRRSDRTGSKVVNPYNETPGQCLVLIRRQTESSPIMSAWVTFMPYMSARRGYVRYGRGRNNYCDCVDCVARAARMKQVLYQTLLEQRTHRLTKDVHFLPGRRC